MKNMGLNIKKFLMPAVFLLVILTVMVSIFPGEGEARNKTYMIGSRGPAGGWIFYDKGYYKDGWRYLEAAPVSQGYTKWGCYRRSIKGVRDDDPLGRGKVFTAVIIKKCRQQNVAARKASSYRGGGKRDWFLPTVEELETMHMNLAHRVRGFNDHIYWSSSQYNYGCAWFVNFHDGMKNYYAKNFLFRVRAVRRF